MNYKYFASFSSLRWEIKKEISEKLNYYEDLIETKKYTDRARDKEDIEVLEKILGGEL